MAKRRTRPMGSVTLEPGGWYTARLPASVDPARRRLGKRFSSRADAERAILREVLEYESGIRVLTKRGITPSLTVGDLIERYIKERTNDPICPISLGSQTTYWSTYKHIKGTAFSNLLLTELKTNDIKKYLSSIPDTKKRKKISSFLSACVSWGNENELFPTPVFFPRVIKRHGKNSIKTEDPFEVRLPLFSEVRSMVCEHTVELRFKLLFLTAFFTGCRTAELLALTPADLNHENNTLTIRRVMIYDKGKKVFEKPKNGKTREQHCPKLLFDYLCEYSETLPEGVELLFYSPQKRVDYRGATLAHYWAKVRKRAGVLPYENGRELLLKDLRAGCASYLVNILGASPLESADFLGHTVRVSLGNYQRADINRCETEFLSLKSEVCTLPIPARLDVLFERFLEVFPEVRTSLRPV